MFKNIKMAAQAAGKNWPTTVTIASTIGLGIGIYKVYKGGLKTAKIIEKAKEQKEGVDYCADTYPEKYTEEDRLNDLKIIKVQTAVNIAKAVGPGIALCALSSAGYIASHFEMMKKLTSTTSYIASLDSAYRALSNSIKEAVGFDEGNRIINGGKYVVKEIEDGVDKEGKPKTKKIRGMVVPNELNSPFSFFFDDTCYGFNPDSPRSNVDTALRIQEELQELLEKRGYVTFQDVLTRFGLPVDQQYEPHMCGGWVSPNSRYAKYLPEDIPDKIDLGIFGNYNSNSVNGYKEVVIINPNCYYIAHVL